MSDDLLALTAIELRRRIGARQLSPVELMDACIARIESLNPFVNAISATDFDRARAAARSPPPAGPGTRRAASPRGGRGRRRA